MVNVVICFRALFNVFPRSGVNAIDVFAVVTSRFAVIKVFIRHLNWRRLIF